MFIKYFSKNEKKDLKELSKTFDLEELKTYIKRYNKFVELLEN